MSAHSLSRRPTRTGAPAIYKTRSGGACWRTALAPQDHLPLFWVALRRQDPVLRERPLPASMGFEVFQAAVKEVLRRVRLKYASHRFSKEAFVRENAKRMQDEYMEKEVIGQGSFGKCLWVEHRVSRRRFACKHILKHDGLSPVEEIQAELNLMKQLDHPNVLRVFEWFESEEAFDFVLEAALGGDLKGFLAEARSLQKPGLEEALQRDYNYYYRYYRCSESR